MASAMDVDEEEVEMASSSSSKGDKKRFEVKKVTFNLAYSLLMFPLFLIMVKDFYVKL